MESTLNGFTVTLAQNDGRWSVQVIEDDFSDLKTSINAVRRLRAAGPAFAIVNVDSDYLVILRPTPKRTFALISDATFALDDDLAADVLDELGVDMPSDDDTPYPEGDFDILADLGIPEQTMDVLLSDDSQDLMDAVSYIAEELGCEDELSEALGIDLF